MFSPELIEGEGQRTSTYVCELQQIINTIVEINLSTLFMVNIQLDRHLPQRCDLFILLFYFGVYVCAKNSNAVGLLCFALDFLFRINLREMLMRRTCAAAQEEIK